MREKIRTIRHECAAPLTKWLIMGVLTLNFVVACIICISLQQSKFHHQNQASTTTQNISQVLDENISGAIAEIDIALLAVTDEAEHQLSTGGIQSSLLNSFIMREHSRIPGVNSLRATDASGNAIYGPQVTPVTTASLGHRDYFTSLRDNPLAGLVISKPLIGGISGKRMIVLARRINRPDGSFAGLAYAGITLDYLTKVFSKINVGPHGSIALFDSSFTLIARYPELSTAGTDAEPKAKTPQFRSLVSAGKATGTYTAKSSLDSIERTFSYRKLPLPPPLYVVVGQATVDFLESWRSEVHEMLLFMAAFLVITVVLTWLFFREWYRNQEAQRVILAGEHRFRSYIENSDDYVFSIAKNGTFSYLTPNVMETFGYDPAEVIGKPFAPFVHPDDVATCAARFQEVLDTGENRRDIQYRILHKDGSWIWYSANVSLLTDAETGEVSFFGIGRDISQQKEWAKQVIELNETLDKRVGERTAQLELALREQESFSYSVSHDLRGPLRHINSYLAILVEDFGTELSQEAIFYLERSRSASAMMGKLIDELLELARIGRADLAKGPVDLSAMASRIVAALKENEPARNAEITIAPRLTAKGDKLLLNLVLENLLGNAWKYSSRQEKLRLEFGSVVVDGKSLFFVKDNGIGFKMEYHDKIFGVFQRLHGREYDGTGIGLATVKRIVERHGGTVWAEAEVDNGTTFYFNLGQDQG